MADRNNLTTLAKRIRPLLGNYIQGLVKSVIGEGPGIDLTVSGYITTVGFGGDTILLYHANLSPVAEYAATPTGLDAALAAAVSGDMVVIPTVTIAGNHTITSGVTLQGMGEASALSGTITNNGTIQNIKVGSFVVIYQNGTTPWLQRDPISGSLLIDGVDANGLAMRVSSPSSEYSSLQLYTRNGANYEGWTPAKEPTTGDFVIDQDHTESHMDHVAFRIAKNTLDISFPGTIISGKPLGARIIIASQNGAVLDTDLVTGGGTDDTTALQIILNRASDGTPLVLIMDGPALITGLNIYSNTMIYCLEGAGFYLDDASNRAMIRNANRSRGAITDEHISIIGGYYNGNETGQTLGQEADNTFVVGMQFSGVNFLTIRDTFVYASTRYAYHISNANNITLDNIGMDCGPTHVVGGQQDGVHLNGPISNLYGHNLKLISWDDALAINAGDGTDLDLTIHNEMGPYIGQGLIQDVIVDGIEMNDCLMGVRLLSHDSNSRINRVRVNNVTGSVRNIGLLISPWGAGDGDIGEVAFDDWSIARTDTTYPLEFAMFRTSGNIQHINFNNIRVQQPDNNFPLFWFQDDTEIETLIINGFTIYDDDSDAVNMSPIKVDGYIKRFEGRGLNWYRTGVAQNNTHWISLKEVTSQIDELILNGVFENLTDYVVYQSDGTLSYIQAVNIRHNDGVASFYTTETVDEITLSNYYKDAGAILSGTFTVQNGDAFGGGGDMLWSAILASQLVNEIKGWPPVINAGDLDALNLWWDKVGTPTTAPTIQDTSAAGLTDTYETCMKVVTDAASEGLFQRFTFADEPRVKAGRKVSALLAIWSVGAISVTAKLVNSDASHTDAGAVSAAAWTIVEIPNHTLAGTYVDLQITAGAAGTFYIVPLGMNIGARGVPLPPRPSRYVECTACTALINGVDPGGATFADLDCTAASSPLAWKLNLQGLYNASAVQLSLFVRRNGDTTGINNFALCRVQATNAHVQGHGQVLCDDGQVIEWQTDAAAGVTEDVYIKLTGWWEWV